MAMALNGNHVNDPQIIYTKTKNLKVELLGESKDKDPIPVNLDGEIAAGITASLGLFSNGATPLTTSLIVPSPPAPTSKSKPAKAHLLASF